MITGDIYEIPINDENGRKTTLKQYEGKVMLIVNVASKCGLAKKNYENLTLLMDKYHDKGLEILLFPCNDFFKQEPGTLKDIRTMLREDYSANFRLFDKISVLGTNRHPLYEYLVNNYKNPWCFKFIKWNFTKFLVGRDGKVIERYGPTDYLENDKTIYSLFEKEFI
ncbi:hypothetical protein COBT_001188 [Conglomerata obtusa]